ncbi:hypothetical protein OAK47_00770 [Planctomycetaceae bacterium]|jgi:hypothetical protein|nr:hypothetical protein [bacterium]MDB4787039.1 hypothetical protein [Planctomycetaceae bacterium]MDC0261730.1 hypothetical protein [Planctomycetaceae bacterium]
MYGEEILISASSEKSTISIDDFFISHDEALNSDTEYLWFSTKATLPVINSARQQLSESDKVVQFCSTDVIYRFLLLAPCAVQAAVGFTGVTAIKTESVRQAFSDAQPKSGVELLSAVAQQIVAQQNKGWRVTEHSESSFTLKSPIPISNSSSSGQLLSVLKNLPENMLVSNSSESVTEILAGLLLIHDFLDASHEYSQSIEGMGVDRNGDYWHGIMHRREPDFGNAKYWFRRVGDHPCFVKLAETAHQLVERYKDKELHETVQMLTASGWDSIVAVDFFQKAHSPSQQGSEWHAFAEELQLSEMLILLTHCCS